MEHLIIAAVAFLGLFTMIASIDGLYFHLWKYRLHTRPQTLYEHKLHTVRAFLFIPTVFFLFLKNFAGTVLWLGMLVVLFDLGIEMMDVLCERDSRASIGGLSSAEYAVHVLATTVRIAAIALILAAKPAQAWRLSAPTTMGDYPALVTYAALNIIAVSAVVGGLHIWLMQKKYRLAV